MTEPRTGLPGLRACACLAALLMGCSSTISGTPSGGSGASAGTSDGTAANPGAGGGSSANGGSGAATATGGTGATGKGGSSATGGTGTSGSTGTSGTAGAVVDPTDAQCAAQASGLNIGRSRLARLTRTQVAHTLRDLLSVTGNLTDALTPDQSVGPFASNALAEVTDLIVQQHQELAAKVALDAQSRMASIAACDLASGDPCVRDFVGKFGMKAFRRPLTDDEVTTYAGVFTVGGTPENGFRLVIEAMLQSPYFLYHADVGSTGAPSEVPVTLTPYELASRLSYFIWDTMPDQALFDLAAGSGLDSEATLTEQVTRMLADPKAKDAIPLFHLQWLDITPAQLGSLASTQPELAQEMIDEATDYTNAIVLGGDGLLGTLFTAPYSYPRSGTLKLYGKPEPTGFQPGMQVMLDPTQRGGIFTQPGFLVKHYRGDEQGSVVHRGITIRENLLCTPIDPPPANVMPTALPPAQGTTARDRFAAHETGTCAGCHTQMDPIGLAFENYDGLGRYRTLDGGVVIDASGEVLDSGEDLAGAFDGPVELGKKFAGSRTVGNCVANEWFRFALGRIESTDDACSLKAVHDAFAASGHDIRQLITTLVLSDAFRHVRAIGAKDTQ